MTELAWRAEFTSNEVNVLHAEAFDTRVFSDSEWDWRAQVERWSLGWVTARDSGTLVGFVNILWDGSVHAWLQDVMVSGRSRHRGVGVRLVSVARDEARRAGCEFLHVDFDPALEAFYRSCGFAATSAGLLRL